MCRLIQESRFFFARRRVAVCYCTASSWTTCVVYSRFFLHVAAPCYIYIAVSDFWTTRTKESLVCPLLRRRPAQGVCGEFAGIPEGDVLGLFSYQLFCEVSCPAWVPLLGVKEEL